MLKNYNILDKTTDATPTVSVAMLAYNHQDYIAQAIESVLMQKTSFSVQIVIAEDCSSDQTRAIVCEYQRNFPEQIKVLLQNENVGMLANNFALLENLNGKYIAVLEGDDYWIDSLKLQKQIDFLDKNVSYAMVFTSCQVEYVDKKVSLGIDCQLETRAYEPLEIFKRWIVPTASVVFRNKYKETIIRNCSHPDIVFPDIVLFLTLAHKGKIFCISDTTCVYRRHAAGLSVANPLAGQKAILHFKAIRSLFGDEFKKVTDHFLAKVYLNMGLVNFKKKMFPSIRWILIGLFYDYTVAVQYLRDKMKSVDI